MEENAEAWEFFARFPGVIRSDLSGLSVDYQAAVHVMGELGIGETLPILRKLEAIARGLRGKAREGGRAGERKA